MVDDSRGLPLTAAGADAVSAFDHALDGYLGLAADTGVRLKATFTADPEMPMAHVLKGYFFMLMGARALIGRAKKAAAAGQCMDVANQRERRHLAALEAWTEGRWQAAIGHWEAILRDHPRDVLALRLAHHGYFYDGDSQNLRDCVARGLHAWTADVPGYGYVLGMRAFGLEETHAHGPAEEAGRAAVAINPEDPWAIHAVAHVYEMTDRPDAGLAWLADNQDGWAGCNNFRYHVWWHRALMTLDLGDTDAVLALYDHHMWDADSEEYLDLINDAALLLRLELHGVEVGDRWPALADKCKVRTDDHILAFIDVHFAIALAAAGAPEAGELMESLGAYAGTGNGAGGEDNRAISRAIGRPLAEAVIAHRDGDFERTVELLEPIRYDLHRLGGSHAQRDLFAMLLLDAALNAGRINLARALAAERLGRRPDNPWTADAYDRAFAL